MTTRGPRSARLRAATVALAIASTAFVGGCSMLSPVQTDANYQPADGVSVDLGPVTVRNLVVVSEAKDAPGTLTGNIANPTAEAVTVEFAGANGASASYEIPARTSKDMSASGSEVPLNTVPVAPGDMMNFTVTTSVAGTATVDVPVLGGNQSYYKTLVPSAAPTSNPS
ncbi:MAG: hypothetical protein ACK5MP_08905 [Nostocoides sp.]